MASDKIVIDVVTDKLDQTVETERRKAGGGGGGGSSDGGSILSTVAGVAGGMVVGRLAGQAVGMVMQTASTAFTAATAGVMESMGLMRNSMKATLDSFNSLPPVIANVVVSEQRRAEIAGKLADLEQAKTEREMLRADMAKWAKEHPMIEGEDPASYAARYGQSGAFVRARQISNELNSLKTLYNFFNLNVSAAEMMGTEGESLQAIRNIHSRFQALGGD